MWIYHTVNYYSAIERKHCFMPQYEKRTMIKEHTQGHILYDSISTNETSWIYKSIETVVARNHNGETGEQFKLFSFLFTVCICEYAHVYMSKHMWRSEDKRVEVGFLLPPCGPTQVVRLDRCQAPRHLVSPWGTVNSVWSYILGWWKHYGMRQWWWLHSLENILRLTQLYNLKGWHGIIPQLKKNHRTLSASVYLSFGG